MNDTAIMVKLNGLTFSQREAEKIVGGRKRLFDLVACGEIRAEKKGNRQNSRWFCNAYDCVKNARL